MRPKTISETLTAIPTDLASAQYLVRLMAEERADKHHNHRYAPAYALALERIRYTARRVLEIGVFHGPSIRVWERYFPRAKIVGLDLRPRPDGLRDDTVHVQGDQGDPEVLERLRGMGPWDLIVDDGSHRMDHQRDTFEALWPALEVGGIYICEDLHTSMLVERRPFDTDHHGQRHDHRFNPNELGELAAHYFLRLARQRCWDRGVVGDDGRHTLLTDMLIQFASCSVIITKVHDGQRSAWVG